MAEVECFIKECCVKDPDAKTVEHVLYDAYQAWGGSQTMRQFARDMTHCGFTPARDVRNYVFEGVRLADSKPATVRDGQSCFTCELRPICHMHQSLLSIIDKMGWMLGGTYAIRASALNQICETLAEACEQYQKQAEQQPRDWVDWPETLAKFLPNLWELAGYDYDKMDALLKQQIVLGDYFDMLSPEVLAVIDKETET